MKKNWILWTSAILITLIAAYYQRVTGPSYPLRTKIAINNNTYKLKFPRSNDGSLEAEIALQIADTGVKAKLFYHFYKTETEYNSLDFKRNGDMLIAKLPHVNSGVKFQYYVEIISSGGLQDVNKEKPVVLRYRDYVPHPVLITHIILMFLAMMFSTLTGLMHFQSHIKIKMYSYVTFVLLLIGGMTLGCLVQKYAFGEYWTGIPFGWDLTDNKTLIAFAAWALALILNVKKERTYLYLIAAIIMLIIFSIPHSMFGTEVLTTKAL